MKTILFIINNSRHFATNIEDLRHVLKDRYHAAKQLFSTNSIMDQVIVQHVSAATNKTNGQIICQWADALKITRVLYHSTRGIFLVDQNVLDYMSMHEHVTFTSHDVEMMPRHHEFLLALHDRFGSIGPSIEVSYILGTTYRIQEFDGAERVIAPYMQHWIDAEQPVLPAWRYTKN